MGDWTVCLLPNIWFLLKYIWDELMRWKKKSTISAHTIYSFQITCNDKMYVDWWDSLHILIMETRVGTVFICLYCRFLNSIAAFSKVVPCECSASLFGAPNTIWKYHFSQALNCHFVVYSHNNLCGTWNGTMIAK